MTVWDFVDRNGFGVFLVVVILIGAIPVMIRAFKGTDRDD